MFVVCVFSVCSRVLAPCQRFCGATAGVTPSTMGIPVVKPVLTVGASLGFRSSSVVSFVLYTFSKRFT